MPLSTCTECAVKRPDENTATANFTSSTVCSDGCRSRATPYDCPTHGASYRAAILARSTDPQRAALLERAKRISKGRFREPHFKYQGDTVVIWNIREFTHHREWRIETMKKTARKKRKWEAPVSLVPRIQSSRLRFRRILRQLYQQLVLDCSSDTTYPLTKRA
jgi:hypothetical protein